MAGVAPGLYRLVPIIGEAQADDPAWLSDWGADERDGALLLQVPARYLEPDSLPLVDALAEQLHQALRRPVLILSREVQFVRLERVARGEEPYQEVPDDQA